jgi:hypothetical protein
MRRSVAALVLATVAVSLAACTGASTGTSGASVPANGISNAALATATPGPVAAPSGDTLSPKESAEPVQQFPTDPTGVPQAVLDKLNAKRPMLLFFYDPTSKVTNDSRAEIDAVMKKYRGTIDLVTFNYTAGIPSSSTQTSISAEVAKAELMTSTLKVKTTPYVLFVDRYGRITYRFAGFVDRGYLEREVLRATE